MLKKIAKFVIVVFLGVAGVILVVGLLASASVDDTPGKVLSVKVGINAAFVEVTNVASPAGGELVVYVNGNPPSAYKSVSTMPAVGESVVLKLADFTTKDGKRFSPITQAAVVVWVGGGGFDYKKFGS